MQVRLFNLIHRHQPLKQRIINCFYQPLIWVLISCLLAVVVMIGVRITGVLMAPLPDGSVQANHMFELLLMGIRFDIAVLLRANLLFLGCCAFAVVLPRFLAMPIGLITKTTSIVALALFILLGVGNLAYINFFGTPYNEFVIEGLLFDWQFILASVFGSGSTIVFALMALVTSILIALLSYKLSKVHTKNHKLDDINTWVLLILIIPILLGLFIAARGTVSAYPLIRKHTAVATYVELNQLVANGTFALAEATENFLQSTQIAVAKEEVGKRLYQDFYQKPPGSGPIYEQFFSRTPDNVLLEKTPPNVVLAVMESFSASLLDEESTGSKQMAQSLASHLEDDTYFTRFFPAHDGTQGSMINLLTNLDFPVITHTKYRHQLLDTSAASIYKAKGYRTLFIYAGYEAEYNNQEYFLGQGFDEYIGAYALKRMYPQTTMSVQGAEDYYAFQYAKERLQQAVDQPLFIVVQTINNHPPYNAPTVPGFDKQLTITERLAYLNGSLPTAALETYYNNVNILGDFIAHLKSTSLGEKTLFAFTGDHGARGIHTEHATFLQQKRVPFYLYFPPYLRPNEVADTNIIASHRDIMPTLYFHSLSDARYPNLGRNLLGHENAQGVFAIVYGRIVTSKGLLITNSANKIYQFLTTEDSGLSDQVVEANPDTIVRGLAYLEVLNWLKQAQLGASQ